MKKSGNSEAPNDTDGQMPDWIRVLIEAAPPLTTAQVDKLRAAFRPTPVTRAVGIHPVDVRQPHRPRPVADAA